MSRSRPTSPPAHLGHEDGRRNDRDLRGERCRSRRPPRAEPPRRQRHGRRDARCARSRRRPRGPCARPLRARRDDRGDRRQLAARLDRGARGEARPRAATPTSPPSFANTSTTAPRARWRGRARRPAAQQEARMNRIDLQGRVAIVTGGAQGIGSRSRSACSSRARRAVLWDVDEALSRTRAEPRQQGPDQHARVELTDERSVGAAAKKTIARTAHRHPRQQRRHHRRQRRDLGARARRVASRDRGQPDRAVSDVPRRRAAHGGGGLRAHRQHRVDRRQGRQPERVALQRLEGRRSSR